MKVRLVSISLSVFIACVSCAVVLASPVNAGFTDVPGNHWAAKAVADLQTKGIVTKQDGAQFNGNQYLTRYEAAVYLDRLVHYIEAGHQPLHTTVLPPKQMPKIAAGPGHNAMVDLAKYGFVDPKDVILTAPATAPVTTTQMSHITAHVIIRLEDRRTVPPTPDEGEN